MNQWTPVTHSGPPDRGKGRQRHPLLCFNTTLRNSEISSKTNEIHKTRRFKYYVTSYDASLRSSLLGLRVTVKSLAKTVLYVALFASMLLAEASSGAIGKASERESSGEVNVMNYPALRSYVIFVKYSFYLFFLFFDSLSTSLRVSIDVVTAPFLERR